MIALIKAISGIAFQRFGPEHLPDSRFLFNFAVAGYILANMIMAFASRFDALTATALVLFETVLIVLVVFGVVSFVNQRGRFRQTATAAFGVFALLQFVTIPFVVLLGAVQTESFLFYVLILAIWVLLVWQVIAFGHILSRAIEQPLMIGIALSLGYVLMNIAFTNLIITAPGA